MNKTLLANKKGMGASDILGTIVVISLGVLVVAIVMILLSQFAADPAVLTNTAGCNSTVTSACGAAYNVTVAAQNFGQNATSKFALGGTIAGFMFVLGLIGGLGLYGYQQAKKRL